jgi:hypothetical protein
MERMVWFIGLGAALLLLVGCAAERAASRPEWPADLTLSHHWVGETVPPPDHYEYSITIGPGGGGEITFYPDYPAEGVPEWRGQFVADAEALNTLYSAMLAADLFGREWQQSDEVTVGGATEWLRVASETQEVLVPAQARDAHLLQDVYRDIQLLVPAEIWADLWGQQEVYRREYRPPSEPEPATP